MGVPRALLGTGEELVLSTRAHWRVLVRPALTLVLATGVVSYLAAVVPDGPGRRWARLALLAGWLVVVARGVVRPYLGWWASTVTLTDRRILLRSGVLSRLGHDVPLGRVDDVHFAARLPERLLGSGTLVVRTGRDELVLDDVPRVEHVHRELYRVLDELGRWDVPVRPAAEGHGGGPGEDGPDGGPSEWEDVAEEDEGDDDEELGVRTEWPAPVRASSRRRRRAG